MSRQQIAFYSILMLIAFILLQVFERSQQQSPDCTSAYLSGAANWSIGRDWQVNIEEMKHFSTLSPEDRIEYRFRNQEDTKPYAYNAIGLMYVDVIARTLFFWQGDLESLITLQQIIHLLFSLVILILLQPLWKKILFFFLYTINPFILYLVDFPYYYFWQTIPTSILLIYILRNRPINSMILVIAILFSFIAIIRPSTLFIILFILAYIAYNERKVLQGVLAIILFIGLTFALKPDSINQPWHTMYIGVGAYPNDYNITLDDTSGFKKFENQTGKAILGCRTNMENNDLYAEYIGDFIKKEYFNILNESPELLVKNAVLNILQSYGLGYKSNYMMVNYLSALIGLVLIILLFWFREYLLLLAIGIASVSFTPYYPPIAAYMFGSYILIVFAWMIAIEKILHKLTIRDEE